MKITFKDVGQGDTILLEWVDSGLNKIGIIDCNKKNGANPLISHLKQINFDCIEFIILTHPHYDHYSGLNELLEYCESNKYVINYFAHTSFNTIDYLRSAVKGLIATKELSKLYAQVERLIQLNVIKDVFLITNNAIEIPLESSWKLKFLYPRHKQFSKYAAAHFKDFGAKINNPNANWLSTFIKIYNDSHCLILTSDAIHDIFWDIEREGHQCLREQLILGQIPHHGSSENYHNAFWKLLRHKTNTPAIISVGENDYGHPSQNVINNLQSESYLVLQTDGAISKTKTQVISNTLDLISTNINPNQNQNNSDITYDIDALCK